MATKEEVIEKLTTIVKTYVEDPNISVELKDDTDLINDLGINSANVVDIVLDVESEFDITIEDDEINQMATAGAAIDLVVSKVSAAG